MSMSLVSPRGIKIRQTKKEYSPRICIKLYPSYLKCCETQSRQQTSSQLQTDAKGEKRAMTSLQ